MLESIQRKLLHLVSHKSYSVPPDHGDKRFQHDFAETGEFLGRFGAHFDSEMRDSTFLDVGCGRGATCIYLALRGAKHVTGVEIRQSMVAFANEKLHAEYPYLRDRVRFRPVEDLGDEKFDIVISKDSFEHYEDPAGVLKAIHGWLKDEGTVYLGFTSLWKSPFGGHMLHMTGPPWAHLIFPEKVLLEEHRRLTGEHIARYPDIGGGLNRMTLSKFRTLLAESDFSPIFLETNVSDSRTVMAFNILKHFPFCEEYFTVNAYTVLQKRLR